MWLPCTSVSFEAADVSLEYGPRFGARPDGNVELLAEVENRAVQIELTFVSRAGDGADCGEARLERLQTGGRLRDFESQEVARQFALHLFLDLEDGRGRGEQRFSHRTPLPPCATSPSPCARSPRSPSPLPPTARSRRRPRRLTARLRARLPTSR